MFSCHALELDYNPIRNDHYCYTTHRSAGLFVWASTNYEATKCNTPIFCVKSPEHKLS